MFDRKNEKMEARKDYQSSTDFGGVTTQHKIWKILTCYSSGYNNNNEILIIGNHGTNDSLMLSHTENSTQTPNDTSVIGFVKLDNNPSN